MKDVGTNFRFGQVRRLTHEEYGSFEPLVSRGFDLAQDLSVSDILFDSDLRAESGKAGRSDRVKYRVRLLDDGAICRGIGEWHPELDDIRSPTLHSQQDVDGVIGRGVAGCDEGNQCRGPLGFQVSARGCEVRESVQTCRFFASKTCRRASMRVVEEEVATAVTRPPNKS